MLCNLNRWQEWCLFYRTGNSGGVQKRGLACSSMGSFCQIQEINLNLKFHSRALAVLISCSWKQSNECRWFWVWLSLGCGLVLFTADVAAATVTVLPPLQCSETLQFKWLLVLASVGLFYLAVELQGHVLQERLLGSWAGGNALWELLCWCFGFLSVLKAREQ